MSEFNIVRTQGNYFSSIIAGDTFATISGEVWTATQDAYRGEGDDDSFWYAAVASDNFGGGIKERATIRLRGDDVVAVLYFAKGN